MTFLSAGAAMQSGEVENALGDDFATADFSEGYQSARRCDVNHAAENGCIPSAHQNGLTPLEPCRVCLADGQGRDVVQRGLNGQKCLGEVELAGCGSMA